MSLYLPKEAGLPALTKTPAKDFSVDFGVFAGYRMRGTEEIRIPSALACPWPAIITRSFGRLPCRFSG